MDRNAAIVLVVNVFFLFFLELMMRLGKIKNTIYVTVSLAFQVLVDGDCSKAKLSYLVILRVK